MKFHRPVEALSAAQTKRAQENWGKLRKHISEIKCKPNYLFQFLDEENEEKQEYMFGSDLAAKSTHKFANGVNDVDE